MFLSRFVLVMALILAEGVPAAVAQTQLRVQQILAFERLAGRSDWDAQDQQRLMNTSFVLQPGGVIVIYFPGRNDIYPLRGTYQQSGYQVQFRAVGRSQSSVAVNTAVWQGVIDLSSGIAQIEDSAGAIMGAVVNGSSFGSNSSTHIRATLRVR
jgi:hypothetical protein